MILAQYPPAPGQRVLVERTGLLVLTQPAQIHREIVRRAQRGGVILAQYPAASAQGVLVEQTGLLVFT